MTHELEIGQVHNRGHLLGDGADTAIISSKLNQLGRDQLPQMIVNEIDTLLADPQFNDRVYRINKLHLSFSITKQDLHTQVAAHTFSQHFMHVLSESIKNASSDSDNIKCYANQVEYMGALISDLLKGTAWQKWQYAEFSSLQYVESEEAAIQLLSVRRECLVPLIQAIAQHQALPLLQHAITPQRARMLFEQWADITIDNIFNTDFLPESDTWVQTLKAPWLHQQSIERDLVNTAVKAFIFSTTQPSQAPFQVSTSLITLAQIMFVLKHKQQITKWLKKDNWHNTLSSADARFFGTSGNALAQQLLLFLRQSDAHAQYITRIITTHIDDSQQRSTTTPSTEEEPAKSPAPYINCSHAGVVLLVPVIVSTHLLDYYSPALIRRALLSIAHAEDNTSDYAWLQWLFPDDEDLCATYPIGLPSSTQLGLDKEQRNELAALNNQPNNQLARLITMQFAIRLSGLQLSTSAYLNQQFLHSAGTVQQNELGMEVTLSPIALNIVLSMSGFSPWHQKLAWLNKTLSIEVRD